MGTSNSTQAEHAGTQLPWLKTACILCECNCGIEVQLDDRRLAKIRGDKDHPDSQGYTCEKPLRLDYYQNSRQRLDTPMRRLADGTYEAIDWDTALDEIAERLTAIQRRHGGAAIAFYGGGGQGNHTNGAHGRALMNAVGAQLYSNALGQEKTGEAWVDSHLYGSHTTGDFDHCEVAVFVGKNPWQSHCVPRARPTLREMARDPRRSIIVIDPRLTETAEMADFHLRVNPGTDAWCLAALVAVLVQDDLIAHDWLREHTVGTEEVLAAYREVDIASCAAACGVPEEQLRAAARRIAEANSVATFEDLGVQMSPNSTLVSYIQKMLWLLTGNYAKRGGMSQHSSMLPIHSEWWPVDQRRRLARHKIRRSVGLAMMSQGAALLRSGIALAGRTAAGRALAATASTTLLDAFFEATSTVLADDLAGRLGMYANAPATTPVSGARVVGGLIPATAIVDEILTDHPRRIRALFTDAANPVHSLPESERLREAYEKLELSVAIDVAMTETARCADYVLPAATQFEKWEASLFNFHFPHNSFQLRAPLLEPLAGTRPEAEIYAEIIDRLHVVDEKVVHQLSLAAEAGIEAFTLAFFATVRADPGLGGLTPYLLYRTLGRALGPGREATAIVWGLSHLAAIAQPDGLDRAGFTETGVRRGQQLFEAILDRREGVTFTVDDLENTWGYVRHEDGKLHLAIPELLHELREVTTGRPEQADPQFPLTLSAGERRSFTANVILRDPDWRRRDVRGALRISPEDAAAVGIEHGGHARVVTRTGSAVTTVEVSDTMQPGHVSLPNGMGVSFPTDTGEESVVGVSLNELTSNARRDKFVGTPWHKNVPARVEPL